MPEQAETKHTLANIIISLPANMIKLETQRRLTASLHRTRFEDDLTQNELQLLGTICDIGLQRIYELLPQSIEFGLIRVQLDRKLRLRNSFRKGKRATKRQRKAIQEAKQAIKEHKRALILENDLLLPPADSGLASFLGTISVPADQLEDDYLC